MRPIPVHWLVACGLGLALCAPAPGVCAPPLRPYGELSGLQRQLVSSERYRELVSGPSGRDRAGVFLILTRRMETAGLRPADLAGYRLQRVDYSRQRFQIILSRATGSGDIARSVQAAGERFVSERPFALFHRGFTEGAREATRRFALQLGWTPDGSRVFVDMDRYNPRFGRASRALHWFEILGQKLTHYMRPEKVARAQGWEGYLHRR